MILKYKIVEVYPEQHSIVVRFYTDLITEDSLAVQKDEAGKVLRGRTDFNLDLPFPAPVGQELDLFISARAPISWLKTQESVLNPLADTSLSDIVAMIGVEKDALAAPAAPTAASTTTQIAVNTIVI